MRYYKWIYNQSIFIPGSSTTSYMLGFWHTYKELCHGIYKQSLRFLFGPVIGELYLNNSLLFKPKLGTLECYFNWFMLCYPFIKKKLDKYINLSTDLKEIILKNIRFIFESAIPFVCSFFFFFLFCKFKIISKIIFNQFLVQGLYSISSKDEYKKDNG